jgi:hypothetical protein
MQKRPLRDTAVNSTDFPTGFATLSLLDGSIRPDRSKAFAARHGSRLQGVNDICGLSAEPQSSVHPRCVCTCWSLGGCAVIFRQMLWVRVPLIVDAPFLCPSCFELICCIAAAAAVAQFQAQHQSSACDLTILSLSIRTMLERCLLKSLVPL